MSDGTTPELITGFPILEDIEHDGELRARVKRINRRMGGMARRVSEDAVNYTRVAGYEVAGSTYFAQLAGSQYGSRATLDVYTWNSDSQWLLRVAHFRPSDVGRMTVTGVPGLEIPDFTAQTVLDQVSATLDIFS